MFFLKASISAEVRAITKGFLLCLHPFIRDRVKVQS